MSFINTQLANLSVKETSKSGLSSRGQTLHNDGAHIRAHFDSIWGSPSSASSPSGIVNLGTSDNYAMGGEIAKFINERIHLTAQDVDYGAGPWGSTRLRSAMARFFTKWFAAVRPISADNIMFASGCTSLCEMLGYTIFEPGEGILLSMPIYQAFQRDFSHRAGVKPVFVPCKDVDEFSVHRVAQYEEALLSAERSGTKVTALVICNPHNPLGKCYEPEALVEYMKMCNKHRIHLIVDEVYALSIYGSLTDEKTVPFTSVLSIESDEYIDKNFLHILYGFSKDFAAGGLRLGCIWTRNEELIAALSGLALFNWPSTISAKIATAFLEEEQWFEYFVEKNKKVIRTCAQVATTLLEEYAIPYLPGSYAGFFLLIDLRGFVPRKTPGQVTVKDEKLIRAKFLENGVYFTSGQGLCCEQPCFFRFCFMQDEKQVRLGVKRLHDALIALKVEN